MSAAARGSWFRVGLGLSIAMALLGLAGPAPAQPLGAWLTLTGHPTHGYVRVPHNAALNPTGNFTFEAWVSITNNPPAEDCRSIAGKNYLQAWWIGLCTVGGKPTLRSYLKGGGSLLNGGQIELNRWTHVAVVYNGTYRLHFINGELATSMLESGPLTSSGSELRIGSDVAFERTPHGAIDEVRLWNIARSTTQIRADLSRAITTPQAGLIAVWALDGSGADVVGPHEGTTQGSGTGFLTFPVAIDCGPNTSTSLCLLDRFQITARWRTDPPGTLTNGQAQTAGAANQGSGLFQFFGPDNWEIMVKALNGCGLNSRYWIFSAATTNLFYRMEVFDIRAGQQKIYFNYPGPPAPAVTDTSAFATCP